MRYHRPGSLGSREADGWRPSPAAARIYLKDLAAADGWQMQLLRCDAGGRVPLPPDERPRFIYVLDGELLHGGHRLWPGAVWVDTAGAAPVESHSDIGCTLLVFRPASAAV